MLVIRKVLLPLSSIALAKGVGRFLEDSIHKMRFFVPPIEIILVVDSIAIF